MTTQSIDPTARRVPPLRRLQPHPARLELKRMLRNRRTMIFTLVMPPCCSS